MRRKECGPRKKKTSEIGFKTSGFMVNCSRHPHAPPEPLRAQSLTSAPLKTCSDIKILKWQFLKQNPKIQRSCGIQFDCLGTCARGWVDSTNGQLFTNPPTVCVLSLERKVLTVLLYLKMKASMPVITNCVLRHFCRCSVIAVQCCMIVTPKKDTLCNHDTA